MLCSPPSREGVSFSGSPSLSKKRKITDMRGVKVVRGFHPASPLTPLRLSLSHTAITQSSCDPFPQKSQFLHLSLGVERAVLLARAELVVPRVDGPLRPRRRAHSRRWLTQATLGYCPVTVVFLVVYQGILGRVANLLPFLPSTTFPLSG